VGLVSYVDILERLYTVDAEERKKKRDEGQLKRGRVRNEDPRGLQILAVKYTMAQYEWNGR
jgi:hypothetical protein